MLIEEIKSADLSNVAIFSGAGVDPDGLASAWSFKLLVEALGGKADCFYRGTFNRPQNKTMREVLGLSFFKNTDEVDWNNYVYTTIISADGPAEVCPVRPHFIIDHHKVGEPGIIGSDVRPVGACSSLALEYIRPYIDWTGERGKLLATALAIGILTDTNNFKEQSSCRQDFEAAAFCIENKDHKSFLSILNWPKPSYYNDLYAYGWNNKVWEGTVLVTGIGDIPEQRSGIISDLAEKFIETNGISTSVVVALVDSTIVMSVRSSNSAIDVDEFCKFFGSGGGKRGAGVARIALPEPLFSKVSETDRQTVFDAFFKIIVEKALQFAGDGVREG